MERGSQFNVHLPKYIRMRHSNEGLDDRMINDLVLVLHGHEGIPIDAPCPGLGFTQFRFQLGGSFEVDCYSQTRIM